MKKLINNSYLHTFLLSVTPILMLTSENIDEPIIWKSVLLLFIASLGLGIFFILLFKYLIKDQYKTGVISSIYIFFSLYYGHLHNVLSPISESIFRHRYMVIFVIIFLTISFIEIKKSKKNFRELSFFLNVSTLFLVLFSVLTISNYFINYSYNYFTQVRTKNDLNLKSENKNELFDIYFILFDGYANPTTLKKYLNYDNNDIINFLEENGFYVNENSRSNYLWTTFTISSALNLDYINSFSDVSENYANKKLYRIAKDNYISKFLKNLNYKIIHFDSGNPFTQNNKYEDINISCWRIDPLTKNFILSTLLKPFEAMLKVFDKGYAENIICQLNKISSVEDEYDKLKFVFSHTYIPHTPYVVNENCEPIPNLYGTDRDNNKKGYLNNVKCVNKQIKNIVNNIKSQKPYRCFVHK